MRYASLARFCWPQKCQATMVKNITRPHTKARPIQKTSIFSTGSFHQSRCAGGCMAMMPPVGRTRVEALLFRERDLGDLHDAPDHVEDGRYGDAEEKQQERIVENALHRRDASAMLCGRCSAGVV